MKKLLLSALALCTAFSLISCGNDTDTPLSEKDPDSWTEADLEAALKAMESAGQSPDAAGQQTPVPADSSFEAKQEILDAGWDSGLFQVDDKLVQLPLHLSEWVGLGMDYEIDSGKKAKDYLFTQNENLSLNLTYNGTLLGSLIITKETETPETAADMDPLIEGINIRKPEGITLYFPGGLTYGDPYSSIEEKLGKGAAVDNNLTYAYGKIEYSLRDIYYGIRIFVNRDSQTLSGFTIGKSLRASDRKDLSTITFEDVPNIQTSDIHNVALLWMPEYKQILNSLTLKDGRRVDSVLEDNGKKYYMSLSFSMLAQKYASPYKYITYGDPVFDTTDENGMNRKVYKTDSSYLVVCSTDVHIFEARINLNDMSDPSADAVAALQELIIEIAKSVQY